MRARERGGSNSEKETLQNADGRSSFTCIFIDLIEPGKSLGIFDYQMFPTSTNNRAQICKYDINEIQSIRPSRLYILT